MKKDNKDRKEKKENKENKEKGSVKGSSRKGKENKEKGSVKGSSRKGNLKDEIDDWSVAAPQAKKGCKKIEDRYKKMVILSLSII